MKKGVNRGFTLVELSVALMVTAIVLSAVMSLAYAMGTANDTADQSGSQQAQLRNAICELKDMITTSKLIAGTPANCLVLWHKDLNSNNQIDSDEIRYIKTNAAKNIVQLVTYDSSPFMGTIQPATVQSGMAEKNLDLNCQKVIKNIIPVCSNVSFKVNLPSKPTRSRQASIQFNITDCNEIRTYVITGSLVAPCYNRLDAAGTSLVTTDDD